MGVGHSDSVNAPKQTKNKVKTTRHRNSSKKDRRVEKWNKTPFSRDLAEWTTRRVTSGVAPPCGVSCRFEGSGVGPMWRTFC